MADVESNREEGESDRGQLILVTGLAVAVTLVALVLLLNTVIYTQNLATRGVDVEDGDAVSFRQEAVAGAGGVVDAENYEEYDSQSKVEQNVTEGIARFDRLLSRYRAERGTVADVVEESVSLTEGRLLRQTNASRDFSAAGNSAPVDWTLVEDAGAGGSPGVRNATISVSRENLSTSASSAFSIRLLGDGGDQWRAYLYDDGSAVTLAVKNGTGSVNYDVCSATGSEATVDLTAGTINGSACPELVWAKGISAPYDVVFRNGGQATGTYGLTVATPSGEPTDVKSGNFAGPGSADPPRSVPAVYAAEFEIHYETPNLAFHTTVRVARGEPR